MLMLVKLPVMVSVVILVFSIHIVHISRLVAPIDLKWIPPICSVLRLRWLQSRQRPSVLLLFLDSSLKIFPLHLHPLSFKLLLGMGHETTLFLKISHSLLLDLHWLLHCLFLLFESLLSKLLIVLLLVLCIFDGVVLPFKLKFSFLLTTLPLPLLLLLNNFLLFLTVLQLIWIHVRARRSKSDSVIW